MNSDVGMHHAKNSGNKKSSYHTIKDTSTIMRNPSLHIQTKGLRMIVLVSLIVLVRRLLVSTIFGMMSPYITVHSVE